MMFRKISHHLSVHPFQRHLFFLGLAILAVSINGYHFGTFDQVFHITFLKKFINPSLYPNDPFLRLRWYHFSYFWFPFIPLLKAGLLEISMFIVHILTVYGTIWMFWALSNLLFNNEFANLLISLALIFSHIGFPGFQIIEFSLLNRTFVLPFVLGSIWLYLKEKKILAFLLLGLMFNLHVIYVIFVLCMFLLNEAIRFQWKLWWKPLLLMGIFVLAGLPVLIWRMQTGSGIDFTLRPEMLDLASRGLLYTVYYPVGDILHVIGNLIAGIGTVWAFILGYRQAPSTAKHRTMRNFAYAIAILICVSIVATYLLPVTILLQMQILRAGVFMLYFGILYFGYFLCDQVENGRLSSQGFLLLGLSFVILISPLAAILFWYLNLHLKNTLFKHGLLIPVILAIQAVTLIISTRSGLRAPGFHIYGPKSPWREVQEWAKENTAIDAMFISPPQMFWHYLPDWRVFSERATIATIPELMEIPFDPEFEDSFRNRFEAVAPGAIEKFNGNYIQTLEITEQAFYTNDKADFVDLSCQFSADYLVVEKEHPYRFETIFQNEGFIIYKLPGCK